MNLFATNCIGSKSVRKNCISPFLWINSVDVLSMLSIIFQYHVLPSQNPTFATLPSLSTTPWDASRKASFKGWLPTHFLFHNGIPFHFFNMHKIWLVKILWFSSLLSSTYNRSIFHIESPLLSVLPSLVNIYNSGLWYLCLKIPLHNASFSSKIFCFHLSNKVLLKISRFF